MCKIFGTLKKYLCSLLGCYTCCYLAHRMSEREMVIKAHIAILFSFTHYKNKSLCKISLCFV